ncbi:hypothetical protein CFD26_104628 [Aspergillus turcosus]|uniref:Uncharacterized protein n=1 Tax=Aspergillus turcosus TaxID=1245748 RepID=A0A3R7J2D3_9EURO|nr:hypothetical protein CFD26_104628 [Aspergillus turcosus]
MYNLLRNSGNANRIRDRAVKKIASFEVQCAVQLARYMDDLVWYLGHRVLALRGGAEPKGLADGGSDEDSDDGLPYLPMPESHSSSLPGRLSPPSSITNIASDQPKANAVIATTHTLRHEQVEE